MKKRLRPPLPTGAELRWKVAEGEEAAFNKLFWDSSRQEMAEDEEGDYWEARLREKGIEFPPDDRPDDRLWQSRKP